LPALGAGWFRIGEVGLPARAQGVRIVDVGPNGLASKISNGRLAGWPGARDEGVNDAKAPPGPKTHAG
jgi:hypothetical protein